MIEIMQLRYNHFLQGVGPSIREDIYEGFHCIQLMNDLLMMNL